MLYGPALTDPDFRRWLGRLQQKRASLRRTNPVPRVDHLPGPLASIVRICFPWTVHEYPGHGAMLADILGVSLDTARKYKRVKASIPAMERARDYAKGKARELDAIASELDHMIQVERANASPVRGWWRVDLHGRDGTRAASDAQRKRVRRKTDPNSSDAES